MAATDLLGPEAGARAASQTPDEFDEAQDRAERQLLAEMMDDTEREIFREAVELDPEDLDGDTSIEEAAGGDDLDPDAEDDEVDPAEATAEDEIEDEPEPQRGRGDVNVALRQERQRRQQLERELAEARGFQRGVESIPRQQEQPPPPPPEPDMFSDPEGFRDHLRRQAAEEATQRAVAQVHQDRVNAALAEAHDQYGDEFAYAYRAFTSMPRDANSRLLAGRLINSPNPGQFLMRWAEQNGLEDYRAQERERRVSELRQVLENDPSLLDDLTGEAPQPRARQAQPQRRRGPPSLNSAGGSSNRRVGADPRGFDGSEQSIFDYAFNE